MLIVFKQSHVNIPRNQEKFSHCQSMILVQEKKLTSTTPSLTE